nr:MAG TPA: hypothetical protein [Caudoviricetes sp.]
MFKAECLRRQDTKTICLIKFFIKQLKVSLKPFQRLAGSRDGVPCGF